MIGRLFVSLIGLSGVLCILLRKSILFLWCCISIVLLFSFRLECLVVMCNSWFRLSCSMMLLSMCLLLMMVCIRKIVVWVLLCRCSVGVSCGLS